MSEDQQESIYKAPEADTSQASADDLMAAYVGSKNSEYYLGKFRSFESGGSGISWNWPAFFVTAFWLLYRRMWLYAFLYWIVYPIGMAFVMGILVAAVGAEAGAIFYYGGWLLISFILIPMFANRLYYGQARSKIAKIEALDLSDQQKATELYRIGGTSNVAWVLLIVLIPLIGILAAIAIPAYQDYTIRAQVSEGLALSNGVKAAVSEFYYDNGAFPSDNAEAGIVSAAEISGAYVSSIQVLDGTIIVTYGNNANMTLVGNELVLQPETQEDSLDWFCGSADIANKHLPAACRN